MESRRCYFFLSSHDLKHVNNISNQLRCLPQANDSPDHELRVDMQYLSYIESVQFTTTLFPEKRQSLTVRFIFSCKISISPACSRSYTHMPAQIHDACSNLKSFQPKLYHIKYLRLTPHPPIYPSIKSIKQPTKRTMSFQQSVISRKGKLHETML